MNAVMGLIHADYRVQKYRLLYSDPAFLVMPPVSDMLAADLTLLPPAPVETQAGRPKKGPRVRKRIRSNGEFNSSRSTICPCRQHTVCLTPASYLPRRPRRPRRPRS